MFVFFVSRDGVCQTHCIKSSKIISLLLYINHLIAHIKSSKLISLFLSSSNLLDYHKSKLFLITANPNSSSHHTNPFSLLLNSLITTNPFYKTQNTNRTLSTNPFYKTQTLSTKRKHKPFLKQSQLRI